MRIAKAGAVLGLALLLSEVCADPERSRRLEECVSADTLLFLSVPDVGKAKEAVRSTALADIWREPEVQEFAGSTLVPLARDLLRQARANADDPKDLEKALAGLGMLRKLLAAAEGELSIALERVDQREGKVVPVLYATAGPLADVRTWTDAIDLLHEKARQGGSLDLERVRTEAFAGFRGVKREAGGEIQVGISGRRVVASFGPAGTGEAFLKRLSGGAADPLSASADYKALRARTAGRSAPIALSYAGLGRILAEALAAADKEGKGNTVRATLDAAGLSGLRAAGSALTVSGKGFSRRSYLLCPGEKKGVLRILAGRGGESKILSRIPAGTHVCAALKADPRDVWGVVRDVVAAAAGGEGLDAMQGKLGEIPPEIRAGLRDGLGGEIAITMRQQTGIIPIPDILLYAQVADEAKARAAVDGLLSRAAEGGAFSVRRSEIPGSCAVTTLQPPGIPFAPSLAIHKGWLVVGISPQAVRTAAKRLDGTLPVKPLAGTEDFARVKGEVGHPGSLLVYQEGPESFRIQYSQILQTVPMIQLALQNAPGDLKLPEIDVAAFPTADAIARHLFGSIDVVGADADGIYAESFQPIPFTLTDVASLGVVAGIALPAVVKAKADAARRAERMKMEMEKADEIELDEEDAEEEEDKERDGE